MKYGIFVLTPLSFQENFKKLSTRININSYFANHPVYPNKDWEKYDDLIEIPTNFIFLNETACQGLDMTIMAAVYDGCHEWGPIRRNPE